MIFFKKPEYSTFLKLFEKNYLSLSYLGDVFKILFCFLKIKKKILQKNCQIFICLLVLLSNLQSYSQISRSLKIKLEKINFLTELFYLIIILESNLGVPIEILPFQLMRPKQPKNKTAETTRGI